MTLRTARDSSVPRPNVLVASLLLDAPCSPPENMARDEALLEGARPLALRRMLWRDPATTLGRFQPYAEFTIAGTPRPSVRRITGGGAILHVGECTMAVVAALGGASFRARAPLELAERVASSLLAALATLAPGLRVRGGRAQERESRSIADCFRRESPFDIVLGSGPGAEKVAGFALCRRGNRVLAQCSVLRAPLDLAPDGDGPLLERWARALGAAATAPDALAPAEEDRAAILVATRYGRDEWNRRVRA